MVAADTNVDRARRILAMLREGGVEDVAELLDERVRMEMPFAPQGTPSLVEGRTAVMEALRFVPKHFTRFRINPHECYVCEARGTVILECTSIGIHRSPDAPAYQNRYVMLFTFENGRLTRWREFFNPYPVLWSAPYLT